MSFDYWYLPEESIYSLNIDLVTQHLLYNCATVVPEESYLHSHVGLIRIWIKPQILGVNYVKNCYGSIVGHVQLDRLFFSDRASYLIDFVMNGTRFWYFCCEPLQFSLSHANYCGIQVTLWLHPRLTHSLKFPVRVSRKVATSMRKCLSVRRIIGFLKTWHLVKQIPVGQ